jgi:hypothetical protein
MNMFKTFAAGSFEDTQEESLDTEFKCHIADEILISAGRLLMTSWNKLVTLDGLDRKINSIEG